MEELPLNSAEATPESEAEQEFTRTLSALGDIEPVEARISRPYFTRLCELLRDDATIRARAVQRLLALDRTGKSNAASALASAIGRTPDPEVNSEMSRCLSELQNVAIRCHAVRALPQNRYGRPRDGTTWVTSSGYSEMSARIEESSVIESLIAIGQEAAMGAPGVADGLTAMAILQSFSWSTDDARVRSFLLEVSLKSPSVQMRRASMAALRHSSDATAMERMRSVVEESRDADEVAEALGGLLGRGNEFAIERALKFLAQGSESERIAAANAVPYVLLAPIAVDTRLMQAMTATISSNVGSRAREAVVASAQSFAASERVTPEDRGHLIAALASAVEDDDAATNVRLAGVRSLNPTGPSASEMSQRLTTLIANRRVPVEARVLAVKSIAQYAVRVPESRLDVASTLSGILSQEVPADLRAVAESAAKLLEQAR